MTDLDLGLAFVLLLILGAEFVNGWTDAPNAIATVVSTRSLSPLQAVVMAAILNLAGVLSGTKVAATIAQDIIDPTAVDLTTVAGAMIGIILWSSVAAWLGIPTSESHALISGLAGGGLATAGPSVLIWEGWRKTLLGLGFSTFLGFGGGLILMLLIYRIFHRFSPGQTRGLFRRLQIFSSGFMAFGHGSNDGQKFMGAFTLALFLSGRVSSFEIPTWVILLCASVMFVGTITGGWRIIRTMGMKVTKLETHQGFAAETGAATSIQIASFLGIPVSTTHTISTAIMGVGAVRRASAVRWGVTGQIVTAWVLTFPICGLISFLCVKLVRALGW
jgi:PiT family inorganic phosphate transporter